MSETTHCYVLRDTCYAKRVAVFIVFILIFCFSAPAAVYAIPDTDTDGLPDDQEAIYYTNPNNPDTDADGYLDGEEITKDFSPHAGNGKKMHENDYDNDGLNDWLERWFKSDLGKADSDNDAFTDLDEVARGYSPIDPTPIKKFTQRIEVDRAFQRLYYYVDGVKLFNFPVSTGNPYSQTPAGSFAVDLKVPTKRYTGPGYDLAGVKWNMRFKPMFYIHGAYWHNDFGIRTHSHGCVNLRDADAEQLYKYVDIGVPVDIVGETPKKFLVGT